MTITETSRTYGWIPRRSAATQAATADQLIGGARLTRPGLLGRTGLAAAAVGRSVPARNGSTRSCATAATPAACAACAGLPPSSA